MKKSLLSLFALLLTSIVIAQPLPRTTPLQAGMDPKKLANADAIINNSIKTGEVPGAVLAVVRDGKMVYLKAYGNKSVLPG